MSRRVDCVWVASEKESRLHIVERRESEMGPDFVRGLCEHWVRGVIGAWSGRPPHVDGYALCEPCCVIAKIFPVLSDSTVSLDEALSRASGSYRPGAHSTDRATALIPRVADVETTDQLPVIRDGLDVVEWPVVDPDLDRPGLHVGVPSSADERSWQSSPARHALQESLLGTTAEPTWLLMQSYRPRHALEFRAEAA